MGTKIEYAIDPLAITLTNSNSSFTLQYRVDDWNYLQARKLKKFQKSTDHHNHFSDSMEKMLENHNLESIKKTMQIHEEIFKHQVHELHRVYSVQKRLMGELKKESKQNSRIWSSSEINSGYILHFQNVVDDARERSGSCSGETILKMARADASSGAGFDLERPAVSVIDEEHVHAAGPSNKMSSDLEEREVELTLSIGVSSSSSSSSKNKKKSKGCQLECLDSPAASFKSNRGEDLISSPNTQMSSSSMSAPFDQEKKMPHWLFGLSINRS